MKRRAVALIPAATLAATLAREWLAQGATLPTVSLAPTSVMALTASLTANAAQAVKVARLEQDVTALADECDHLRALLRWTAGQVSEAQRVGRWRVVEEELIQ